MALSAIPRATYRLQLHAGFGFAAVQAEVPYLARLGVSHLYLSPVLTARPGSTHGYDIVDHAAINPELGGMAGFERLAAACRAHAIGIILDFVPNHMGIGGADNIWWLDVLEWGEDSPFARYFDIDWLPARRELKGKLLLPFLGDHYGAVLERGELEPRFDPQSGTISLWYWEHRFPIAPGDYAAMLEPAVAALGPGPGGDLLADAVLELRRLGSEGRSAQARRHRAASGKAALAAAAALPAVRDAIDAALAQLAGQVGHPASFAALHRLLENQAWRLSYWRVAADEINYRRFFNINDLAALRMVEEPALFAHAHRLTLDLVRRGLVQGLRIDHVDGLFNPAEYCRQLQALAGRVLGTAGEQPLYLVVEKILAPREPIRTDWPVAGTTGYDFLNQVGGLFVDGEGEGLVSAAYDRFVGRTDDFERLVREGKALIMDQHMASELRVLTVRLGRIAFSHWRSRDFTLSVLYAALRDVVACLPVYRTYVTSRRVTDNDRRYIGQAVARARALSGGDPSPFDFIGGVLDTSLGRDGTPVYSRRAVVDFAMRWQQYTGPVMAKGCEDTAFYRYNRLICLNEVGGDPKRFGIGPAVFHQAARARARSHPHALLATATHDTKRGEDTRLRIAMLAGLAEDWSRRLERWHRLNAAARAELPGGPAPEPADEVFVYQSMLGMWPADGDAAAEGAAAARLEAAAIKSVKEAKRRTSWSVPDEDYEQAVAAFVRRICAPGPFLDDFRPFLARVAVLGMAAGLGQTAIKLTAPGVPDIYQGCELWDLSLVDPDNRRPVDYARRLEMLGRLESGPLPADPVAWRDGAVKQELVRRLLDLRRRHPALFSHGAYRPLTVRGNNAVLAYARQDADAAVVVAVPLLLARLWPEERQLPPLAGDWRGLHVEAPRRGAAGRWRNLLTGEEVAPLLRRGTPVLGGPDLFARFPLAVLEEVAPS